MWRQQQRFTSLVCLPLNAHSLYTWRMKCWISLSIIFIALTVHTCDIQNHDILEWFLNCILLFSQSIHATYETMTDLNGFSIVFYRSHSPYTWRTKPWQTTTSVGFAQARPQLFFFNEDQVLFKYNHNIYISDIDCLIYSNAVWRNSSKSSTLHWFSLAFCPM